MEQNNNDGNRYLCFSLGVEQYAIPLLSVREVIALPEITPVPQTPSHYLGIMNLRGQVISVMDLRTKLSIKPGDNSETSVIICDLHPNPIGVVVDSIHSVLHPKASEVSAKPEIPSQKTSDFIQGVFRHQDKLVLLLDIAKTLSVADQQAIMKGATVAKQAA